MTVTCDYCGKDAALVGGKDMYPHRPDLYGLQFWKCSPCDAWVGCHKRSNAVPLGRLANAELRKAKSAAHAAFDPIWKSGSRSRRGAYEWLSKRLGVAFKECHIGMFDIERCQQVVTVCNEWRGIEPDSGIRGKRMSEVKSLKDYCNGFVDGTQNAIKAIRAAGYQVEGE